jgi:hypothetical protein
MKTAKQSNLTEHPEFKMPVNNQNILSEHELLLIRETAKLTENLYVKMVCDNLAMEKILRLM